MRYPVSLNINNFRSSLAFAQEVQDSKQMDDLMGKVTNLFSASTTANAGQKGKTDDLLYIFRASSGCYCLHVVAKTSPR